MAFIRKLTRVSNPRKHHRRSKATTRNAKGRFVKITRTRNRRHTRTRNTRAKTRTKAPIIRRYNVKALKNELKRRGVKLNPTRRKEVKRHKRHTRRKQNPVLIELGALNPRRRKNVAKKASRKRRRRTTRNPRRHAVAKVTPRRRRRYTRRRRTINPVARRTHRRRRTNTHRRRRHHNVRRNPALFGRSGGKDLLMMVGGGLVGVAATKYLPTLLPASITGAMGGGAMMSIAISGAGAFAAGWLSKRFVGPVFGDAVLFGGLMQVGSAILTAVAPASISAQLALSGVGDIVPGMYVVPQNPIRDYRPPAPVATGTSGMGNLRRFGTFR